MPYKRTHYDSVVWTSLHWNALNQIKTCCVFSVCVCVLYVCVGGDHVTYLSGVCVCVCVCYVCVWEGHVIYLSGLVDLLWVVG